MNDDIEQIRRVLAKIIEKKQIRDRKLGLSGEKGEIDADATIDDFQNCIREIDETPYMRESKLVQRLITCSKTFFAMNAENEALIGSLFPYRTEDGAVKMGLLNLLVYPMERTATGIAGMRNMMKDGDFDKLKELEARVEKFDNELAVYRQNYKRAKVDAAQEVEEINEDVEVADEEENPPENKKATGGKRGYDSLPP
jgi:predicted DNA-binding protein YlxM (UPF0122 family)